MRLLIASLCLAPALAHAADAPATPIDGPTRDKMVLCVDAKKHYVAIAPDEKFLRRLYYGDGKTLRHVDPQHGSMMTGDWFVDPRFFNPQNNESFRGMDLRVMSHVEHNADKNTCVLTCGAREQPLAIVPHDDAQRLLEAATFVDAQPARVPYALARDQNAVYYYVDRGAAPGTEKSFRLFVGKKGALKLQKMTDVAADSEGEIFATATGSLRLILAKGDAPKSESTWIAGKKKTALTIVPVEKNLNMIYNDLGVYAGQRLGNPCDDI